MFPPVNIPRAAGSCADLAGDDAGVGGAGRITGFLALPRSGWLTIRKLTFLYCSRKPSTLERERAGAPHNWCAQIA